MMPSVTVRQRIAPNNKCNAYHNPFKKKLCIIFIPNKGSDVRINGRIAQ